MKKCPNRAPVFATVANGVRIPMNRPARRELAARMRKLVITSETPEESKMRVNRRLAWRRDRRNKLRNLCGAWR